MRILGALLLLFLASRAAFAINRDRVYYEIFVRSFQDSDGDGIGDLRGILARLDYLKDLGVGGIWLTPIFKSPSYHGYDTVDYRAIQPAFGTLADLDALIAAAHARDIHVMLDLAINHTSSLHPWFSARHDWYVWRAQNPAWPGPQHWFQQGEQFYYAFFGATMPDLNLQNAEVVSELKDATRFWLARGIDGFRLDAARYYIEGPQGEPDTAETHALIRELASYFKSVSSGMSLVGEVWSTMATITPYISSGTELDLAFDFPFSGGLLASLTTGTAAGLSGALHASQAQAARLAPFVTNHDMVRIASQLSRQASQKDPASIQRILKLAAAALFSQPGTPFVYYGEEIGLSDGHTGTRGDRDKRTPMQWERAGQRGFTAAAPWIPFASDDPEMSVQAQQGEEGSLLQTYRALIALRSSHPALQADSAIQVLADPSSQAVAYLRAAPQKDGANEQVLVVLNFGATALSALSFDLPGVGAEVLWGEGQAKRRKTRASSKHGKLVVSSLPAQSAIWIQL